MRMKKIATILFAAIAVVFALGESEIKAETVASGTEVTTQAEIKIYGDYQYIYNEEYAGIEILRYNGTEKNVTIPDRIENIPVTVIGEKAFMNLNYKGYYLPRNKTLETVAIPENVRCIKERAFDCCVKLKEIVLPDSVEVLGEAAFSNCEGAKKIKLSENLTEIPQSAFGGCESVKKIIIPANVVKIGYEAFSLCLNLRTIQFAKDSKLKYLDNHAIEQCFKLERINLPEGVESIGVSAFEYCIGLKKITIPKTVTYIGGWAFVGCKNLKKIVFKGKAPTIDCSPSPFVRISSKAKIQVPTKYKRGYKKLYKKQKWYKKYIEK